jgi:ABC-type glycerol-3-phosphate transport system substrate-binding protein
VPDAAELVPQPLHALAHHGLTAGGVLDQALSRDDVEGRERGPARGVWYWAIPAAATQVDQAWAFIRWIASKAANAERVGRGGSPVRTSTMTDPRVLERGYGRDYYEAVSAIHQRARPLVSGPNAEEAIRSLGEAVHGTITGEIGVDDAVTRAARQVAELLGARAG